MPDGTGCAAKRIGALTNTAFGFPLDSFTLTLTHESTGKEARRLESKSRCSFPYSLLTLTTHTASASEFQRNPLPNRRRPGSPGCNAESEACMVEVSLLTLSASSRRLK